MVGKTTVLVGAVSAFLIAAGQVGERVAQIPGSEVLASWSATGFLLWYAYYMTKQSREDRKEFTAELRAQREARAADREAFRCANAPPQTTAT